MTAYEGNEIFIFASYAYKDSKAVLPILEAMQNEGFRIWFDDGIRVGTKFHGYIEEHIENCAGAIIFMSNNAANSSKCLHEINCAIENEKDILVVYLEETRLPIGMELRLFHLPSVFRHRHASDDAFLSRLMAADMLACCKGNGEQKELAETPVHFFEFVLNPDGSSYSVESGDGFEDLTEAVIPAEYRGLPVTAIADEGFYESTELARIKIPASITSIGNAAFMYCPSLSEIYYGGSREERKAIAIGRNNEPLLCAGWHLAK